MGTVGVLMSAPAYAGSQSCLGTGKPLVIIDETLVGVVNPEGGENQLRVAYCLPLTELPGILHDYDGFEFGLFNYATPIYTHQGVYAAISPLSFLELRAAAAAVAIWPLPVDGFGYYGLSGYHAKHADADLPAANAKSVLGLDLTFTAVLQGEVEIAGPYNLIITNVFSADYWNIGSAPYFINLRQDAVLARSDWLIKNNGSILIDTRLSKEVNLHVGINDDLTFVPAAGYVGNIVSLFVSVPIRRENGSPRDIEPFIRLGTYTHHESRTGFMLFGGISVAWGKPVRGAQPATAMP